VDVIVATPDVVAARAARKARKTIPIVFTSGEPLRSGLVSRLDRPNGNLTGISLLTNELEAKRLDLLKEVVPRVSHVAVVTRSRVALARCAFEGSRGRGDSLRVKLQLLDVRERQKIDDAFAAMTRERAGALLVMADPMFFARRERIVDLATRNRLPAI
jgi:putative ABC transport system substrate-binding protein